MRVARPVVLDKQGQGALEQLARGGITLRRRVENGLSRWQLKLPRDEGRDELEAPGGPAGPQAASWSSMANDLGMSLTAVMPSSGRVGCIRIPAVHSKLGISTSNHEPVDGISGHQSTDFTSKFLR